MEQYCINHSTEKAVGLCGTCKSPACYRCSLTIDQVIYCSPECFNELDPPSSSSHKRAQARLDEFSDVVSAITTKEKTIHAAPNPSGSDALDSDESGILAPQMDQPSATTLLGMSSVPDRRA